MFKEKLVIDIMKRNYSKIQCLVGDTLELDIDILSNGEPFNIESFNTVIEQGLENGKFNIQSDGITKDKNNIICSLSNKFTSSKGKHAIDISIFKNEYKKTTFKIPFEVYEGAISENSEEQEIFISVLDEIKSEVIKAQEIKNELTSKINQSETSKSSLTQVINTAGNRQISLTSKIQEADNESQKLNNAINTADLKKNELNSKINEANNIKYNLDETVNTASSTRSDLNHKIEEAEGINNTLVQNIQSGNIYQMKNDIDSWNNFKRSGGEIGDSIYCKGKLYSSQFVRNLNTYTIENDYTIGIGLEAINESLKFGVGKYGGIFSFCPPSNNSTNLGSEVYKFKDLWLANYDRNTNGYSKLPNGLIIQWGKVDKNASDIIVNFPIAFPNRLLYVSSSLLYDADMWSGRTYTQLYNNASFRLVHLEKHPTRPATPIWLAIGY